MAVATVSFRGQREPRTDVIAYQILNLLRDTRARSISYNTDFAIYIDLKKRFYWSDRLPRKKPIPQGVDISVTFANTELILSDVASFRFFPNGGSSGGTIQLRAGKQSSKIIVDWMTGAIQLDEN